MLVASIIALVTLAFLSVLQFALIAGAPLGNYAWGGQHKVLPAKLRFGSACSILIYAVFASFILSKSGIWVIVTNDTILKVGLWIMTLYLSLGIFLNAISRSKRERNLMTPVSALLAATFFIVAIA